MNHKIRAKGIIGRGMPQSVKHLGGWYDNFVTEVARGLRLAEREARRHAIRQAANLVGDRAKNTTNAIAIETLQAAAHAVLELRREPRKSDAPNG